MTVPVIIDVDPRGRASAIINGLGGVGQEFVRRAGPYVVQQIKNLGRQARSTAPVRRGNLRRSIRVRTFQQDGAAGGIVFIDVSRLARRRGVSPRSALQAAVAAEFGRSVRGRYEGTPYFYRIWRAQRYQGRITGRARRVFREMVKDIETGRLSLPRLGSRGLART